MKGLVITMMMMVPFWLIADEKEITSKVNNVTVFLSGAQVTRTAKATIEPGKTTLKFTGISAQLNRESVQIKSDGDFTILSVSHQLNFMKAQKTTDEIKKLQSQLLAFKKDINLENNMLAVYQQEEQLLLANKMIGGQQNGVKISELEAAANLFRNRLTEIKLAMIAIRSKIKTYKDDMKVIAAQLTEINANREKSTSEIFVTVMSKKQIKTDFKITYVVEQAAWFPTYDIRVKDVSSPVDLSYKATVFQLSGEDWTEVKMTLSTGNPFESGVRPTLSPWYLSYNNRNVYANNQNVYRNPNTNSMGAIKQITGLIRDESGEALIGASVLIDGTSTGVVTDIDGRFSLNAPVNSTLTVSYVGYSTQQVYIGSRNSVNVVLREGVSLDEVVVTGYGTRSKLNPSNWNGVFEKKSKEKKKVGQVISSTTNPVVVAKSKNNVNLEFEIEVPYTILTNGKEYTVEVQNSEIPAIYQYYCTPKVDLDAFLVARITDWEEYNLLSGDVNLFFEDTYLGKSYLDVSKVIDTLELSLGRDKDIVVKREKIKDYSKRRLIGNTKVDSRTWEITVRNKKNEPINIIIEDQVPVSQTNEIVVDVKRDAKANRTEHIGKLIWTFDIPKSDSKTILFEYTVTYPKQNTLVLE